MDQKQIRRDMISVGDMLKTHSHTQKWLKVYLCVNNKAIRYKYYCMRHIKTCGDKMVWWLMIYLDNEHLKIFIKYYFKR